MTSQPTKTKMYRYLRCQRCNAEITWRTRNANSPNVAECVRTGERVDETESADDDTAGCKTLCSGGVLERLGRHDSWTGQSYCSNDRERSGFAYPGEECM